MSSKKLIWTRRFSRDVKRARRRNWNLETLQTVIEILQSAETLPQEYKPLKIRVPECNGIVGHMHLL